MISLNVQKFSLDNGLTLLVVPRNDVPKVSLQLWYNVGSKDEQTGEKGIAHLIEHMIFKGTTLLSESDINFLTYRLSGSCNAFTSHDYTGYLFNMPTQHWREVLPVMADCMQNCTFKQPLLNSELKAVVQEIKMYNDDYLAVLLEKMITAIFPDHPYHYPVIGYKHDLWHMKSSDLLRFYKKHYVPNNATLVVVGDVDSLDALRVVKEYFGNIPHDMSYEKETLYHCADISAHHVSVYRDIQKPACASAWVIPGVKNKQEHIADLLSWVIGAGKGSRLYKKLVNELDLVTDVQSFVYDLFDHGLFFIYYQPHDIAQKNDIENIIREELLDIALNGITQSELARAQRKTQIDLMGAVENNERLAYLLGKFYLATGDEKYLDQYAAAVTINVSEEIQEYCKSYLRPSVMHTGSLLNLLPQEHHEWLKLQKASDGEDEQMLGTLERNEDIEPPVYAEHLKIAVPNHFNFPHASSITLNNGLKVLYYHSPSLPKVEVIVDLKAKYFYDPEHVHGLSMVLADMLQEGTKKYSADEFAQELEGYGMSLDTFPGHIGMSMLAQDLEKGFELMRQILQEATLSEESLERVKAKMYADIKNFWDSPGQFASQLLKEEVYHNHPYSKPMLGTEQSIAAISRNDLVDAYRSWMTPHDARLILVGDLTGYDIPRVCQRYFGTWTGPSLADISFPQLQPVSTREKNYSINRDQVVLCYGGLSVNRFDKDYDKLLLFDQVLTGGVLGGMNSRLFALREQSGLFYSIGGSLLAGSDYQPGMVYVKTIVSHDRLAEAEAAIEEVLCTGAVTLTNSELEEAQRALINALVDNFATQRQIASTMLFLDKYGFDANYLNNRAAQLLAVTVDEVKKAVKRRLQVPSLVKIRIGRV